MKNGKLSNEKPEIINRLNGDIWKAQSIKRIRKNAPLISIIMSIYNEQEEWIRKSIESILEQTWKNIEFIIVNDNPENEMGKMIINEYIEKDTRIQLIENERNVGLARSLNRAWQKAKGSYIARMDADDISFPERLEKEIYYLERNGLDMVSSNRIILSEQEDGNEYGGEMPEGRNAELLLPYGDIIVHPSVLLKKSVLVDLNGYRNLVPAEDYDLWLRMLSSGYKIGILDEPLIYYRMRGNGISNSNAFKQFLLTQYVKKLYHEREKGRGTDSFSEENLNKYMEEKYSKKKKRKYEKAREYFDIGIQKWKKGRRVSGIGNVLKIFFIDYNCTYQMFLILKFEIKKKYIIHINESYKRGK